MTPARLGLGASLIALLACAPAAAQTPQPRLLVAPARADFNRDGRADTAVGLPLRPDVVRVSLSGAAIHDIVQPAAVISIAGLDYDRDGDVDLLVGTAHGPLLWLNEGAGEFSKAPVIIGTGLPLPDSPVISQVRLLIIDTASEGSETAALQPVRTVLRLASVTSSIAAPNELPVRRLSFSRTTPRAPPL